VKTFVLEKGNNSLFAGCLGFKLCGLCSMKDNSSNKNEACRLDIQLAEDVFDKRLLDYYLFLFFNYRNIF
jgi:hypothetical protein